ncbi:SCO family protein [Sulfurifustis variabilis]|uniref:SCO family protein n=1 Tax=Sulfurifustis variabilis TaxID=1675686 RepID=UPI001472CD55|nr:SCO family protein [Sulfurifustis variabilis]
MITLLLPACTESPALRGMDLSGVDWGRDFTLVSHQRPPVSTEAFRGKVLILFFGYTHCPDICGPTLAKLAALQKELGPEAEHVQVLFVTIDPERDTPEQLRRFVPQFDPRFIGLTGTPEEIAAAAREYKVGYMSHPGSRTASSIIQHSGNVFVKDQRGRPRSLFANETPVVDMAHDVQLLLKSEMR